MDVVTTSPDKPQDADSGAALVLAMLANRIPLGLFVDLVWSPPPATP
jgi:hypothetical protein